MNRSRLSPRQKSYEADLINKLSDNHQLNQAKDRLRYLNDADREDIEAQLSARTKGRLSRPQ